MKFRSLFIVICGLCLSIGAQATVTPSDVYSRVKAIESVIQKMSGNKKQRIATIKLIDAKPLHVYAIGTALNEKILILNELGNKSQYIRPGFPSQDITPAQVLTLMLAIEHNLKLFNIDADFVTKAYKNKQPKDVLRVLVRCNLLLDNLLDKKILPSSPYRVVGQIEDLLTKAVQSDFPNVVKQQYPMYNNVKPNDVFVNAENMFNTLMSATSLKFGIDYPSRPYYSPYNNKHIKPIHVFTITVMNRVLLQDFMRRQGQSYSVKYNDSQIGGIEPANVYQRYEKALMLMRIYLLQ
ncbi:MAG: hypothetical protein ACPG8A_05625 [Psychrobium sp.]